MTRRPARGRTRMRWRRDPGGVLADVAGGCRPMLELRYPRQVERAPALRADAAPPS